MATTNSVTNLLGEALPQAAISPEGMALNLSNLDLSAFDPRNFGIDPSILGLDPSLFDTSNTPQIPRPGDGSQISPEAVGEMGSANAQAQGTNWNQILMQDVQGVTQAQSQGADATQAVTGLATDYTQALQEQANIDPNVQAAVHAILGQALGNGQGSGSAPASGGTGAPAAGGSGGAGGAAPAGGSAAVGAGGASGGSGGSGATGGTNSQGGSGGTSSQGGVSNTTPNGPGEAWSGELQSSLNQALTTSPQAFQNSMGSWAQGSEGDCASIAVIKASMNEYGNQVLSNVTQTPQGYNITMQDGYQEAVTPQMLSQASQMADLTGADNQSKSYATLLFAAMAGRASQQGVDGITSYSGTLQDMVSGYNPTQAATNLGLENHMETVNPSNLGNDASVVGWSSQHAVFIQNGNTVDHYGTPEAYNGTDTIGDNLSNAFEFTPDSSSPSAARPSSAAPASGVGRSAGSNAPASGRTFTPGSSRTPGVPRAVSFSAPRAAQTRTVRTSPASVPSPRSSGSGWHGSSPWAGTRHPGGRGH